MGSGYQVSGEPTAMIHTVHKVFCKAQADCTHRQACGLVHLKPESQCLRRERTPLECECIFACTHVHTQHTHTHK